MLTDQDAAEAAWEMLDECQKLNKELRARIAYLERVARALDALIHRGINVATMEEAEESLAALKEKP
tara:strand:+ start:431 stop:631 length:201 start_codon:yes stop_codon:yes gene_type:complete